MIVFLSLVLTRRRLPLREGQGRCQDHKYVRCNCNLNMVTSTANLQLSVLIEKATLGKEMSLISVCWLCTRSAHECFRGKEMAVRRSQGHSA